MKFTCTVDIDVPLDRVVQLFSDPYNLKEWQDGFVGFEHLSGKAGEPGAKSRLSYKMGKGVMELIETINVNNLPTEFTALYEAKSMTNTMKSTFTVLSKNTTCYTADIEYLEFRGVLPKVMAFLMPGMFKKQVQKWLNQFKDFAEIAA